VRSCHTRPYSIGIINLGFEAIKGEVFSINRVVGQKNLSRLYRVYQILQKQPNDIYNENTKSDKRLTWMNWQNSVYFTTAVPPSAMLLTDGQNCHWRALEITKHEVGLIHLKFWYNEQLATHIQAMFSLTVISASRDHNKSTNISSIYLFYKFNDFWKLYNLFAWRESSWSYNDLYNFMQLKSGLQSMQFVFSWT